MLISSKYKRYITKEWGGKRSKKKERSGQGKVVLNEILDEKQAKLGGIRKRKQMYNIGDEVILYNRLQDRNDPPIFSKNTVVDVWKQNRSYRYISENSNGDRTKFSRREAVWGEKMYKIYLKSGKDFTLI